MEITMKTVRGDEFAVTVQAEWTVLQVKEELVKLKQYALAGIKLICAGKVLKDTQTLSAVGVTAGSFMVVMVSKVRNGRPFSVQHLLSSTHTTARRVCVSSRANSPRRACVSAALRPTLPPLTARYLPPPSPSRARSHPRHSCSRRRQKKPRRHRSPPLPPLRQHPLPLPLPRPLLLLPQPLRLRQRLPRRPRRRQRPRRPRPCALPLRPPRLL
jgi:hypothetical protein